MNMGLTPLMGESLHSELINHMPLRAEYPLGVCLVVDADRTLTPEDSGRLIGRALGIDDSIRQIFEELDYVDEAFIRASGVWSSIHQADYMREIEKVAAELQIRSPWLDIFREITGDAPVVVVTAGIPQVWRRVLSRAGHDSVPVFGGCHQDLDEYAISAQSKAEIVIALRDAGWVVVAAGDSRVDLLMLAAADIALFVPDHKGSPALRAELGRVPSIRHLLVDKQCFDSLKTCTADETTKMILQGGLWDAN